MKPYREIQNEIRIWDEWLVDRDATFVHYEVLWSMLRADSASQSYGHDSSVITGKLTGKVVRDVGAEWDCGVC